MKKLLALILPLLSTFLQAQTASSATSPKDTTGDSVMDTTRGLPVSLDEVTVEAFYANRLWKTVPAAVAVLGARDMERYANTSFVPLFNLVPGVRIEERSPASYRLSIRGSLLRSPFGVRNVKVYWNDIPLTDGGGNTYLNLVDLNTISAVEVVKGPAASTYGAGTGGAVLLRSENIFHDTAQHRFTAGSTGGSYGLFQQQLGWQFASSKFSMSLQQVHQQSDGYREQSATRKDIVKWQGAVQLSKQALQWLLFYTDLYYQTPGAITLAQFEANPRLARQPAGALPGAVQQQTAIYNKTLFGGLHHDLWLGNQWMWKSFVSGNHTAFTNPFITNYEERSEVNTAAGTQLIYHIKKANSDFQWTNGAEWLHNHSLINNYGNRGGVRDTVQFKDDIFATQWFAYSQAQWGIGERWMLTAGISLNNQSIRYRRTTDPSSVFAGKTISGVLTPRVAVLYRVNRDVSLYALAARGFSPPALAEVRPSDGNYYGELNAEYGWNFEAGIKGHLFAGRLQFDVAAYFFRLQNAIVRRTHTTGAEYFVNAGGARQNGAEAMLRYHLVKNSRRFVSTVQVWSSYAYQPYRFTDYTQAGMNYSGNELTGVPRTIWVSGIDVGSRSGIYFNASLNATAALPLTDANDAYASAYQLVQGKIGYKTHQLEFFAGADNLLDQHYSLGNDLNALGKRYYNAAPGRNLFAGTILRF